MDSQAALVSEPLQLTEATSRGLATDASLGLLGSFAPEIEQAKAFIHERVDGMALQVDSAPFEPVAIVDHLMRALMPELLTMVTRTMVLELNVARLEGKLAGDTPEQRYAHFITRLTDPSVVASLRREYPALVEQVDQRLNQRFAFFVELLEHLKDDWSALRSFFSAPPGKISALEFAGDPHRRGRSVVILSWSSGEKLVYKPRSLAVDVHFQDLLSWLNACGAAPPLRQLQISSRADHGWTEFLEHAECQTVEEVERFYQRQGAYVALLYALNAVDFHCENIIACGEHPMLIDLEGLFHAHAEGTSDGSVSADGLLHSVLSSGLLPWRVFANEASSGIDVGGLVNPAGQLTPTAVAILEEAGTDAMHVVRRRIAMAAERNCPKLNGADIAALDYVDAILHGFASTYRVLSHHRQRLELHRFADDEVRFIARPTRTYGMALSESYHPDLLREPEQRSKLFDKLRDTVVRGPLLGRLLEDELQDMAVGDVPIFTSRPSSRHIWSSRGRCIADGVPLPALLATERRIAELSEPDLARQLWLVRASIATLASPSAPLQLQACPLAASPRATSEDELVALASEIGDRLVARAFRKNGRADWIGMAASDGRRYRLMPASFDLYDGVPGIILFLAHLSRVTGKHSYATLAGEALLGLREQLDAIEPSEVGVGGFCGAGGIIYALCQLPNLLDREPVSRILERVLDGMEESILADRACDVMSGAAGLALALRSLGQVDPGLDIARLQRACGLRLIELACPTEHGIGWVSPGSTVCLTGFAHGNAGIAHALLIVANVTAEDQFARAAWKAIAYERALFDKERGNWPDLRPIAPGACAMAWCHGAPGIALGRLGLRGDSIDPITVSEIEVALATTIATGFHASHIACHGTLGNLDILLQASQVLRRDDWERRAREELASVIHTVRGAGWHFDNALDIDGPGLMTGLAGIGYTLLRFADPVQLPCALTLEPPRTSARGA